MPALSLKKNLNASRPSEHQPVRGKKCQKRLDVMLFDAVGPRNCSNGWDSYSPAGVRAKASRNEIQQLISVQ